MDINVDIKLLKKYDFKNSKIEFIKSLPYLEFEIGCFGGRAKSIAKIEDENILILVNERLETIGVVKIADAKDEDDEDEIILPKKKINNKIKY